MISNRKISAAMTVKLKDLFDQLPAMPTFQKDIRRAPKRKLTLNQEEIGVVVK